MHNICINESDRSLEYPVLVQQEQLLSRAYFGRHLWSDITSLRYIFTKAFSSLCVDLNMLVNYSLEVTMGKFPVGNTA
jgi:hypothetical protein